MQMMKRMNVTRDNNKKRGFVDGLRTTQTPQEQVRAVLIQKTSKGKPSAVNGNDINRLDEE